MIELSEKISFGVAIAFYGISTVYGVFLIRAGFRRNDWLNYLFLFTAFVFQTISMMQRGLSFARCPVYNMYEAILFVSWSIVLAYLIVGLMPKLRFLSAFAAPVLFGLGILALMPNMDQPVKEFTLNNSKLLVNLHATLSLLSYGLFGLASLFGAMYIFQAHNLKFNKLKAFYSLIPPMERLEKLVYETLLGGILLLTIGLIIGAIALKPPEGMSFHSDPKVYWSACVWLAYLILLVMYKVFYWGMKKVAIGVIGCFSFVLLTFWGVNMLSQIHHP